jgi:hypothetical protein
MADILGSSTNPAEKQKAIESLEHVHNNAPQKKQKERALYRIVTILSEKGEWPKVNTRAKEYLTSEEGYSAYAGFVSLLLSQSYDKQGMREDAIASYAKTFGAFTGQIAVSAPAVTRILELTWERNQGNDRQTVYELGYKYRKITQHLQKQMKDHELVLWKKAATLTQQYEDHSSVVKIVEEKTK